MAHQFPSTKPLERKKGNRPPRKEFIIVSEGAVTEPFYFNRLQDLWRYPLLKIWVIEGAGVPTSVVARAIEVLDERKKEARRNQDSFERFEVWALFDRDNFPAAMISEAFQLAQAHGIEVAHSNPCFELWGLMHFSCYARPGHHHDVHRALRDRIPTYHHDDNPRFCPKSLQDKYPQAVQNSAKALNDRLAEHTPHPVGDPSTTVHVLTERIREAANR